MKATAPVHRIALLNVTDCPTNTSDRHPQDDHPLMSQPDGQLSGHGQQDRVNVGAAADLPQPLLTGKHRRRRTPASAARQIERVEGPIGRGGKPGPVGVLARSARGRPPDRCSATAHGPGQLGRAVCGCRCAVPPIATL